MPILDRTQRLNSPLGAVNKERQFHGGKADTIVNHKSPRSSKRLLESSLFPYYITQLHHF